MSAFLTAEDKQKMLAEVFNKDKFVLVCPQHKWAYGSKRPPNFKCKQCQMISFVGLMCNTPPNRREEVLEMLEYSVNHLVEADKKGLIDHRRLLKRPEVTVEKDAC